MYSFNITSDNAVEVLKDGAVVDTVGPWDSADGASSWGQAVVDKYNSAEYAAVDYPSELPKPEEAAN